MSAWAGFVFLALLAIASVSRGIGRAWVQPGDFDMRARAREYEFFRQGVYPNRAVAGKGAPANIPFTVYPPYALPMFACFFEPGGRLQGRILIELLSLVSLVVMGVYGLRELSVAGPAMAAVGGIAGAAILGNSTALAVGQFSIICTGLVVQQMIFLARDRPLAAGLCWSLAMLKPQIALAFACLFLVKGQWRGLVFGILILAGLSLFACWWTDVSPARLIHHWMFRMPMSFSDNASMSGPGYFADQIGLSPRIAQFLALSLLGGFTVLVWCLAPVRVEHSAQLHVAGVCGVLGQLLFYHRSYDNIMLFPTLISILVVAATAPSWITIGAAGLMGMSVWLPQRMIEKVPGHQLLQVLIWSGVAAVLLAAIRRRLRCQQT
jgi:hypothetical protein